VRLTEPSRLHSGVLFGLLDPLADAAFSLGARCCQGLGAGRACAFAGSRSLNLWVGEPSGRHLQLPGLRIAVTLQRIAGLRSAVPLQRRGSGAKPVTRVRR
jgi:hypothetical protein